MNKPSGGPAFSRTGITATVQSQTGMSLRDYFAAAAMQAEISAQPPNYWREESSYTNLAKYAFRSADAMIVGRAK